MQNIKALSILQQAVEQQEALLVLFGGQACNVCHVIKPKIEEEVAERFPKMAMVYIDCHKATDICSQNGVFTLPAVQVYFTGQRFIELKRTFSVSQLVQQIERPYQMLFSEA